MKWITEGIKDNARRRQKKYLKKLQAMPMRNTHSQVGNYKIDKMELGENELICGDTANKVKVPSVGDLMFYYPKHNEVEKLGTQPLPAICMCSGDMSPEITIFTANAENPVIVKRTVYHVNDWKESDRLNDPDWIYAANGYWSYSSEENK